MLYTYQAQGTCSREIEVEMEGEIIREVRVVGGCAGNLAGISKLLVGRTAKEVVPLLKGILCGEKKTSCPDQLARALEEAMKG